MARFLSGAKATILFHTPLRRNSTNVKIYTKTGDQGTTSLFTGTRLPKDDAIFEALGTTDELSSFIGFARQYCASDQNGLADQLEQIQCILQELGSHIATPRHDALASPARKERTLFPETHTVALEQWIDKLDAQLPPLTTFILPSGGQAGAALHCARSVCRRAERTVVPLSRQGAIDPGAFKYLNRLSDYLFMAARFAAKHAGVMEVIYRPSRPTSPRA